MVGHAARKGNRWYAIVYEDTDPATVVMGSPFAEAWGNAPTGFVNGVVTPRCPRRCRGRIGILSSVRGNCVW